jgi:hypothetical protein
MFRRMHEHSRVPGRRSALPVRAVLAAAAVWTLSPGALEGQPFAAVVGEVIDDRFSAGMLTGGMRVELTIHGEGKEKIKAARFLAKDAKDDAGGSLLAKDRKEPDFDTVDQQMKIHVELGNPPRRARSFRLSGKLELFVPSKDPNAVVKVPGALAAPDKPIKSPGLKSAKVEVTVLSKEAYAAQLKSEKLDDAKIAEIRAEAKKHGANEKEIEMAIGFAKAMQEMDDAPLPDGAVVLSGKRADMEKIVEVGIERPDGTEIDVGGRSSSSNPKTKTIVLRPHEVPPPGAALVFTVLTDKAKLSVPVDFKEVPLP